MKEYDLSLKISPSDKEFKKIIGDEAYEKKKAEILARDKYMCCGCDRQPMNGKGLLMHVEKINEENPIESECSTLCLACHATQHIDVAIKNGWVEIVNSLFSQRRLISECRTNNFTNVASHDNTRILKTKPEEYLQKILDGTVSPNTKAKVIFTSAFEWGDL
jgi:hypothetical protein